MKKKQIDELNNDFIQNDGVGLALRDKINLYSGISAVDDPANNRANFSLGGTLAKNTDIDTGDYDFNIIKGTTALKMKTEAYFNLGGTGANGSAAYGISQFASGDLIVGGDFSEWNGDPVGYIVKLSNTGTQDTTFATNIGTGFDSQVLVVKITSTNKIIVGGYFSDFNGAEANGIYALNADGTPDSTFNTNIGTSTGSGLGNWVSSIAIDETNGLIFLAGFWSSGWNGNATYNHFIALNFDGTVNAAFMTNMGTGFDNETTYVHAQADSKVVVGGYFSTLDGVTRNALARLNADGTPDSTFNTNIGTGPNGNLKAVGEQSDGGLIMSTHGSSFDGTSLTNGNLFRLSSTGVFDTTFYANLEIISTSNQIYGIAIDADDDSIIFSGYFLTYGAHDGFLVRLNADGTYATSYGGGILNDGAYSTHGNPLIIDYSDNKKIYLGTYSNYDIAQNNYPGIIRFTYSGDINTSDSLSIVHNTTLSGDTPFAYESDVSMNYTPRSLVDKAWVESQASTASNGLNKAGFDIRLGGDLNNQTEIDARGWWMNLKGGAPGVMIRPKTRGLIMNGPTTNNGIFQTLRIADGSLIMVGSFRGWNGAPVGPTVGPYDNAVKLSADGVLDETFNTAGLDLNGAILDIKQQSSGKYIIAGAFTTINGNTVNRIARLNSDGTYDSTFDAGTGFNKSVFNIAINGSDEIYCVGDFETFNGGASAGLRKLDADGATVAGFNVGLGLRFGGGGNSWATQVKILTGGKILVAGPFNIYDNSASFGIVRINEADGTKDGTFVSPLSDGERCRGFDINSAEDKIIILRNSGARIIMTDYDGAVDSSFVPGTGLVWNTSPSSTAVDHVKFTPDDQHIFVAGLFDTYKGVTYAVNNSGGRMLKIDINGDVNAEWVANTGINMTQFAGQNRPQAMQFLPDGKLLYTIGFEGFYNHRDIISQGSFITTTKVSPVVRMYENGTLDVGSIEIRNTPLYYANDYSGAFDDLSLVHKKYVDDSISAASGWTLNGTSTFTGNVLINGNDFDFNLEFAKRVYMSDITEERVLSFGDDSRYNIAATAVGDYITIVAEDRIEAHVGGLILTIDGDGARYNGDYSANYTNRSLVDKEYVDSVAAGGGWPLTGNATLTGNVTIDGDSNLYSVTINDLNNLTLAASGNVRITSSNIAEMVDPTNSTGFRNHNNIAYVGANPGSTGATDAQIYVNSSTGVIFFGQYSEISWDTGLGNDSSDDQALLSRNQTTGRIREVALGTGLQFNSGTGELEAVVGPSYNFTNGITEDIGDVKLGGSLTESTTITTTSAFSLTIDGKGASINASDIGTASVTVSDNGVSISFNDSNTRVINVDDTNFRMYRSSSGVVGNISLESSNVYLYSSDATNNAELYLESSVSAHIRFVGATAETKVELTDVTIIITGTDSGFEGIKYNADYSANYTDRSLVDQEYVMSIVHPAPVSQNISGSVSIDLSTGDMFFLTLTGNVTSFDFTNEVVGRAYTFYFLQDTTYKTLSFAATKFRFSGGSTPALTDPTTNGTSGPARSVDIVSAVCQVSGRLDVVLTPDMIEN